MSPSIVLFLTGLIVGSFLNVCIYRLPRSISVIRPPSNCPVCHNRIKAWQNIPVLSYLFLKGKCYYCGSPISIRYPVVELLNGIFYLLVFYKYGLTSYALFYILFLSAIVVITFIDIDFQIIPDKITLPGIIIGLIAGILFLPDPLSIENNPLSFANLLGLKGSLIGLLTGGGLFYIVAVLSRGGMGGGDIKMMAMVGASLGWKAVLMTTFFGSLIGSVYGIGLILLKGKGRKTRIPFGPFLSAGVIITLFYGRELLSIYLKGF